MGYGQPALTIPARRLRFPRPEVPGLRLRLEPVRIWDPVAERAGAALAVSMPAQERPFLPV
jgi:hypothetical protein